MNRERFHPSRGNLVDDAALAKVLIEGRIAGKPTYLHSARHHRANLSRGFLP
jgi:hypothetical protein